MSEHEHDHHHGEEENPKAELIKILAGAALFGLSFLAGKFVPYEWIRLALLLASYVVLGGNVVLNAVKGIFHGDFFDENFLMSVATIGAAILGDYNEAVFVMLFYSVGEFAQDLAADKARDSIEDLMDIEPESARLVLKDGSTKEISPEDVKIGDRLQVLAGELVPVDGRALTKGVFLDTKSITGESVPLQTDKGTMVLSGSVVQGAPLEMEASSLYEDSTVSKVLELVEQAEETKAPSEKFITKFARVYTPVVTGLAVLLAVVPSLFDGQWLEWTHRALTFLVISCPCALVLSIPLTFFAGIGSAASKGILIKGGTYLQELSKTDTVVFDKTGTLTTGEFRVREIRTYNGFEKDGVLKLAAAVESNSHHPIARAICNESKAEATAKDIKEIPGRGLTAKVGDSTVDIGNLQLMIDNGISFDNKEMNTIGTTVYVSVDGKAAGCIVIGDSLKENAPRVIKVLRENGISRTVMLSGDNSANAQSMGKLAGLDLVCGDLLPQDKVEKLKELKKDGVCTYVGDGINDAPVLIAADCSIAMGKAGSASAIEAAGTVIMNDNLESIPLAMKISRKTVKIATQNIAFAIGVKVLCMVLGALGITGMEAAVFADTGVALLCVLNSLRALGIKA